MANVRNDYGIAPFAVKGFPKDATELTMLDKEKYGVGGHRHSWLNAQEIVKLYEFIKSDDNPHHWFGYRSIMWAHCNMPYFLGNSFDGFLKYPGDWRPYGIEDVRFVFFFDN